MLKANSKMFHDLCEEGIKDDKKDVFVDAFTEFIAELDDTDLSNKKSNRIITIEKRHKKRISTRRNSDLYC